MRFNCFIQFWRSVDENGSMTWSATSDKLSILYYFNIEILDLNYLLSLLNAFACEVRLDRQGWKLPFKMNATNAEPWINNDYLKRIEFYVKK